MTDPEEPEAGSPERVAQLRRFIRINGLTLDEGLDYLDVIDSLRSERDFWEEERHLAGMEAFSLGEALGKAQGACKRLRERGDAFEDMYFGACIKWLEVKGECDELKRRGQG